MPFFRLLFYTLPLLLLVSIVTATPEDSPESLLESHLWQQRVILIFTNAPNNPDYIEQKQLLAEVAKEMHERDIISYEVIRHQQVSRNGEALPHLPASRFFAAYAPEDPGFALILIGKDGEIKQRWHQPVDASALFKVIDAMPMRQREIQGN